MDAVMQRWVRSAAGAATLVVMSVGCGGEPAALVGAPVSDEVADLTVVSDDRRVTTGAACIAEIPDDLSDCPGSRDTIASIELDETRKGALIVPADIATGGYRLRVDGAPLPGSDGVLDDQYQVFRIRFPSRPSPDAVRRCSRSRRCAPPVTPRRSGSSCSPTRTHPLHELQPSHPVTLERTSRHGPRHARSRPAAG